MPRSQSSTMKSPCKPRSLNLLTLELHPLRNQRRKLHRQEKLLMIQIKRGARLHQQYHDSTRRKSRIGESTHTIPRSRASYIPAKGSTTSCSQPSKSCRCTWCQLLKAGAGACDLRYSTTPPNSFRTWAYTRSLSICKSSM